MTSSKGEKIKVLYLVYRKKSITITRELNKKTYKKVSHQKLFSVNLLKGEVEKKFPPSSCDWLSSVTE